MGYKTRNHTGQAAYTVLKRTNRRCEMRKGMLELGMGLMMVFLVAAVFYCLNGKPAAAVE